MLLGAFLLALVGGSLGQHVELDDEGVLHVDDGMGLRPGGMLFPVVSHLYPASAPSNLRQSWRIETFKGARIRVTCTDIRIPTRSPGKCDEHFVFIIEDGDDVKEYCGTVDEFSFLSATNSLMITLKVGKGGWGFVSCTAQGRALDEDGTEVTEPPTTPRPVVTSPSYRLIETEEEDSSEFGVSRGRKTTNCDCGWTNKKNSRIVGGKETGVNEYPYMAAMVFQHDTADSPFCGGSIVSPFHVVTAAHCTHRFLHIPLAVRIGDHDYTKKEGGTGVMQVINVERIVEHEDFNRELPLKFDMALLVLEKEIRFTKLIGPICLPRGRLHLDNQNVRVTGWGRTSHYGVGSEFLKKLTVRVVPEEECFGQPTPDGSRLCVYARNKSSCMGDSGGPVAWLDPETNRYTLVGLVSYGSLCGGQAPTVNADVTRLVGWLYRNIMETKPEAFTCSKID